MLLRQGGDEHYISLFGISLLMILFMYLLDYMPCMFTVMLLSVDAWIRWLDVYSFLATWLDGFLAFE